jgi:hypothetical protein
LELDCVTGGHPCDRMQGENRGRCVRLVGSRSVFGYLEPADVENTLVDAVVPTCIFLVAIEAQAEAVAFLLSLDTRLSRASIHRIAGPRLRSS